MNKSVQCLNCGSSHHGKFCSQCGQRRHGRLSFGHLFRSFLSQATNIERGFLYTIGKLFTDPGQLISDYWKGKTLPYYNPFRYVLILTALSLLINFWLGIDDLLQEQMQPGVVTDQFGEEQISNADRSFDSWLNILVLLLIPVNAFTTRLFFKKSKKNFGEHFVLNAFILGQGGLITSVTNFIFFLGPGFMSWYIPANFLVGWIYNSYVFSQVFEGRWYLTSLKAVAVGIIGMAALLIFITIASALALFLAGGG